MSLLHCLGLAGAVARVWQFTFNPSGRSGWVRLYILCQCFHDMVNSRILKPFLTCLNSVK